MTLVPHSHVHQGWVKGVERFVAAAGSSALAGLAEVRAMIEPGSASPTGVVLVLRTVALDAIEALREAAQQAFPGLPIQLVIPIEPKPGPAEHPA